MSRISGHGLAVLLMCCGMATAQLAEPGDAVIRGKAGPSEIVITTTKRLAGAVHSLKWLGKEFIDSTDHGRQLQSACAFDAGRPGQFWAEAYNPTEAGSRRDGVGPRSTSRLLYLKASGSELMTVTRAAFWLNPGEQSSGRPALNATALSDHLISKHIRIGYQSLEHAIEYRVTFTVPPGERHNLAQFEAVTGYMPAEFSKFWSYNLKSGKLEELSDGPGEQAQPVILARPDHSYAMGVWSPMQPSQGYESAGYGRFRFAAEQVVKWNCVFRLRNPNGIPAGNYSFRCFVIVGTLQNVQDTLTGLLQLQTAGRIR